jgi:aminopeptidase P (EC:3.4.11.9). Metallo peptidase. MEROPS family M24B
MPAPTADDLQETAARRARLMAAVGADDVVVVPAALETVRNRDVHYRFRQDSDFDYLTGFPEPEAIALLLPGRSEGAFVLFVRPRNPERETWDGRRAGPEGAEQLYGADQAFEIEEFAERLPELLAGRRRVHSSLGEHPEMDAELAACVRRMRETARRGGSAPTSFVALEETLHEQRLIKSAAEQALLRRACSVSAQAHVRAMRYARPGVFEYQVMAEIEHGFALAGMEPGYGSIVGGGDNACILHYVENDAELRDGDLLLIDAGGEYRGYTADITRTFPVNGRFSGPQRDLYALVLAAQLAAIEVMRVGESRPGRTRWRPVC